MSQADASFVAAGADGPVSLTMHAGAGLFRLAIHPLTLAAIPAAFMIVFFLLPVLSILQQSIRDMALTEALPGTSVLLREWDGVAPVPEALERALVEELRSRWQTPEVARLPFRLNQEISGFRSLINVTGRALARTPAGAPAALGDIDPRWDDFAYWRALKAASGPVTIRNLLAALDLSRSADGELEWIDEHQRIHLLYLARTIWVAAIVTLVAILIGYPLACAMAVASPSVFRVMMLCTLIPFWTSLLVRTSAWVLLLRQNGVINNTLMSLGLIDHPLDLIFNRTGLYVAMVHILLPFMILPLYAVVRTIPRNQMWAASALGATPAVAFLKVFLPQSLPGVAAGGVIVFILSTGFYITPALVGGRGDRMTSSLIEQFAFTDSNWGMAASLALILLLTVGFILAAGAAFLRIRPSDLRLGRRS